MTLRLKTLTLTGVTLIILISALYVALRSILLNGFTALEQREIQTEVNGVLTFLTMEADGLYNRLSDWSSWDDSYTFVSDHNQRYITENLLYPDIFDTLQINVVAFLDRQGELVYIGGMTPTGFNMSQRQLTPFLDAIAAHYDLRAPLAFSGFVAVDNQVVMAAGRPILNNDSSGAANGTLIWVRLLDEESIGQYMQSLTHRFSLMTVDDPQLDASYRTAIAELTTNDADYVSDTSFSRVAYGYSLVNDLSDEPSIVVRVAVGREVFREGLESTLYYLVTLLIIGLILILCVLYILENFVLVPILRLSHDVRAIGTTQDFSTRLPVRGKDELAHLAGGINTLLAAVESSSEALRQLNSDLETRVDERTREIEEKNRELARLQAQKDVFFARASHELRTPLTNIITRVYLLEKQPQQLEAHLRVLKLVSTYMRDLINEILEISRIQRGSITLNRTRLELQTVVRDVIDIQLPEAEKATLTLRAELVDPPITVSADYKRLTQILTNLVTNAIHYTPANGEIVVSVEATDDQQARISVRDNGVGIALEHLPHLFEPFFRAREDISFGTGLGLMIVRELVKLHGGEITVDSTVGQGSTFTVLLPLLKVPSAEPTPEFATEQRTGTD